jgi:hypothetical protein
VIALRKKEPLFLEVAWGEVARKVLGREDLLFVAQAHGRSGRAWRRTSAGRRTTAP